MPGRIMTAGRRGCKDGRRDPTPRPPPLRGEGETDKRQKQGRGPFRLPLPASGRGPGGGVPALALRTSSPSSSANLAADNDSTDRIANSPGAHYVMSERERRKAGWR